MFTQYTSQIGVALKTYIKYKRFITRFTKIYFFVSKYIKIQIFNDNT